MKTVYVIIGTRPDAIKMAPVYRTLSAKSNLCVKLVSTGQHKELLASALRSFNLRPDIKLGIVPRSRSLSSLTQVILRGMERVFKLEQPDLVLVHGDTATCYAASLACFYNHIPVYHIEAGLRSHNISSPYPEEFYRKSVSLMAHHHFVPTEREKLNLLTEGINEEKITIIGNTIHEAMQTVNDYDFCSGLPPTFHDYKMMVLITIHRREKNEQELYLIMNAIKNAAIKEQRSIFIYPVHPNPVLQRIANEIFCDISNIIVTGPMEYKRFINMLHYADLILTDSGGVQEEAAFLGKKVFVLREHIERTDGVDCENTKVLGLNYEVIENAVINYLDKHKPENVKFPNKKSLNTAPSEIVANYILTNSA